MRARDQRRRRRVQPYKRKIHFSEDEVWSYRFTNGKVAVRTPDCETTFQIPLPEISHMTWDEMERGEWKGWWKGVGPQKVKEYILFHLRPDPNDFPVPTLVFMHPLLSDRWHLHEECHFLPHLRHRQKFDPDRVFADDLEGRLGEKPNLRNLCGACMARFQSKFRCMDCHDPEPEYYMVWNELWQKAVPEQVGQLCFSCLGKRLGRPLRRGDFPPHVPLNQFSHVRERILELAP